jgi:hypothetical protein
MYIILTIFSVGTDVISVPFVLLFYWLENKSIYLFAAGKRCDRNRN